MTLREDVTRLQDEIKTLKFALSALLRVVLRNIPEAEDILADALWELPMDGLESESLAAGAMELIKASSLVRTRDGFARTTR